MNGKKLSRVLQAIGLVGLGYEAIKTYRAHKKSCLEQERREKEAHQQMITNSGLKSEEEFTQILSEEDPMVALPKLLLKSSKWDMSDFWNGQDSNLDTNTIIVSQEMNNGRKDWCIRIKLPEFIQNLPKVPHYKEQIDEALKEFGCSTYWVRILHKAEYNVYGFTMIDETGRSYSEVGEVSLQNNELDYFKTDSEPNGSKRFFELFKNEEYEEIEDKLGFTQNQWFITDPNVYLSITIPYNEEMGLSRMQDLLIHLLGTQVTNTELGGRYTQNLGPVVFQATKRGPLDNTIRYYCLKHGDFIEETKKIYYDEEVSSDEIEE
jgi:hypothetical protein